MPSSATMPRRSARNISRRFSPTLTGPRAMSVWQKAQQPARSERKKKIKRQKANFKRQKWNREENLHPKKMKCRPFVLCPLPFFIQPVTNNESEESNEADSASATAVRRERCVVIRLALWL